MINTLSNNQIIILKNKSTIVADFLVTNLEFVKTTKSSFANITINNGESTYSVKVWSVTEADRPTLPEVGQISELHMTVEDYNGVRGFVLQSHVAKPDEDPIQLVDKHLHTKEEYLAIINDLLAPAREVPLFSEMISVFFKKYPDKLFCTPAATGNHHAYPSGWIQHSLEVLFNTKNIVDSMLFANPTLNINVPLVLIGAFLHDVGKLHTYYTDDKLTPRCTDKETLLGHSSVGSHVVYDLLISRDYKQDFTSEESLLLDKLSHIIASHHNELEWGAVAKPACVEAIIVHYADQLSAKVTIMCDEQSKVAAGTLSEKKSYIFETRVMGA